MKNLKNPNHKHKQNAILALLLLGWLNSSHSQTVCNDRTYFIVESEDSCVSDAMNSTFAPQHSDGVWVRDYLSTYANSRNSGTVSNININGLGQSSPLGVAGINILSNQGTVSKMINVGFPWSSQYYSPFTNLGRINTLNNTGTIQQGIALHSYISSSGESSIGNLINAAGASILNSGFVVTNPFYTYTSAISLWYDSNIGVLDNSGNISSSHVSGTAIYMYSGDLYSGDSASKSSYITTLNNNSTGVISSRWGIQLTGLSSLYSSRIDTLTNSGLIRGTDTAINLDLSSSIGTLINQDGGLIRGVNNGILLQGLSSINSIVNSAGGVISADSGSIASRAALNLSGTNTVGTFDNYGVVKGSENLISTDEINAAIRISSNSQISTLNNFSTGTIGTVVNGGVVGVFNNSGMVTDIWNVGSTSSLRISVINTGSIESLTNLQGPLNSNPLLYQGVLPASYNIWIAGTNNYGQLSANSTVSGRMIFNVSSGNTSITSGPHNASPINIANNTIYQDVLTGISLGNLSGPKYGTVTIDANSYSWMLLRDNSVLTTWDLCFGTACPGIVPVYAPLDNDTYSSLANNVISTRNSFNLQSAKTAQGLTYDCTVFDANNMCVSFAGTRSYGNDGIDNTTGALIIAHRPTANIRVGGYVDQTMGTTDSNGLKVKRGSPGYGVFGVWSQRTDGLGTEVRLAANSGSVDIETTRLAIGTAEAGFGQSNIKSNGVQLELSQGYAANDKVIVRPYVGYRQVTNKRAAYTESSSADFPLAYSALKQTTESVLVGSKFFAKLTPKTTLNSNFGFEYDVKTTVDNYQATNADIGPIDPINMSSNVKKARPVFSVGVVHALDKTQTVGFSLTHRKEALASSSTWSAYTTYGMLQYSVGF